MLCFNTQPPEGGWSFTCYFRQTVFVFQHTAARRRLEPDYAHETVCDRFNTQPPEGGWHKTGKNNTFETLFQHTAARRRLENLMVKRMVLVKFQHTAARRRLVIIILKMPIHILFQHTAARRRLAKQDLSNSNHGCFNTQPPEGGWS